MPPVRIFSLWSRSSSMPNRIPYQRTAAALVRSSAQARTETRLEMNRFYAHPRWRRLRRAFLMENPLCDECSKAGRTEPAIDVHHIKERSEHPALAYEWTNLQALCKQCHAIKTRGSDASTPPDPSATTDASAPTTPAPRGGGDFREPPTC
jgi:5-methylcytosine-specific restriction enzyme A